MLVCGYSGLCGLLDGWLIDNCLCVDFNIGDLVYILIFGVEYYCFCNDLWIGVGGVVFFNLFSGYIV